MDNEKTVLVTGATGSVGRHVVSELLDRGVRVRALVRNPESSRLAPEVALSRGDLSQPGSLEAASIGIDAAFLLWRLESTETVTPVVKRLAEHARRIVFLSSSAIQDGIDQQAGIVARVHAEIEHAIEGSSREWTFLRPDGFAKNALWWWGRQITQSSTVRWPFANAAMAPIHEKDIAAVAVRALCDEGHRGKKYILSGPESLTLAEQVKIIGEAIGRPLHFEETTPDEARRHMDEVMPQETVDVLLGVLAGLTKGPAHVTTVVNDVTGAPARTFWQWAEEHAADFQLSREIQ